MLYSLAKASESFGGTYWLSSGQRIIQTRNKNEWPSASASEDGGNTFLQNIS
jgi:hypothetical protein